MLRRSFLMPLTLVSLSISGIASGVPTLELVGSADLAVQPGTANSPTDVFPLQGPSVVVWARISNSGAEVLELTGPGGVSTSSEGAALWHDFPASYWDPLGSPDDPLVETPLGYPGLLLESGESFTIPILEIWGIDFTSEDPLFSASIGSVKSFHEIRLSFWEGFDRDPNDPFDAPDVFPALGTSFTVTVVPEPSTIALLTVVIAMMVSRRAFVWKTRY